MNVERSDAYLGQNNELTFEQTKVDAKTAYMREAFEAGQLDTVITRQRLDEIFTHITENSETDEDVLLLIAVKNTVREVLTKYRPKVTKDLSKNNPTEVELVQTAEKILEEISTTLTASGKKIYKGYDDVYMMPIYSLRKNFTPAKHT